MFTPPNQEGNNNSPDNTKHLPLHGFLWSHLYTLVVDYYQRRDVSFNNAHEETVQGVVDVSMLAQSSGVERANVLLY